MSTITLTHESKKHPDKFRCDFKEATKILELNALAPVDDTLPVQYSSSKIGIIGGGFGGLSAALTCIKKLKEEDIAIFEKHLSFGGTWYANTYPGCASDIPALWYSFFEELNTNWSALRPPQFEMLEYIDSVVEKYKLKSYARFKTAVTACRYNNDTADWTVEARNLETGQKFVHTSKLLIFLAGGLVYPRQFDAPGLHDVFEGSYMHSALWDHSVDFKNKNVVVLGNGCSAAQVVPALLKTYEPKQIVQIFRSKHWIMPPLPRIAYFLYKLLSFHRWGLIIVRFMIASFAEAKYPLYNGSGIWASIVRYISTSSAKRYMKKAPKKYHDLLIPDFKIGCKRMIYDYKYIPSLQDERLEISDDQIDHVEAKHVVLKSGRRLPCDIIVACTGYDIPKTVKSYGNLIGKNGKPMNKQWEEEGATAYETILVKNFPNLFVLGGPNSATGHSLVVLALENGSKYFEIVARKVLDGTYKSVEVKPEAYDSWNQRTQKILSNMVFGTPIGGCVSWYTANGRNETAYPYSQIRMWWAMGRPNWNDFILLKNEKKNV